MAHRVATDEICVLGVWGNPHQAAGGGLQNPPPAVFWLQKTLLAQSVMNEKADTALPGTGLSKISVVLLLTQSGYPACRY